MVILQKRKLAASLALAVLLGGKATAQSPETPPQEQVLESAATPQQSVVTPPELAEPAGAAHPLLTEEEVRTKRDTGAAVRLGWNAFRAGNLERAAEWFTLVQSWEPDHADAALGLGYIAVRRGQWAEAERLARLHAADLPTFRALLGQVLAARAGAEQKAGRHEEAVAALEELSTRRWLSRDESLTRGWALFRLGRHATAGELFARLYRTQPDLDAAEGLYHSSAQMKSWAAAEELARELGGPLAPLVLDQPAPSAFVGDAQFRALLASSLSARAVREAEAKRHAKSSSYLAELDDLRALTRDERQLRGWNAFHVARYEQALGEFEQLYREVQDQKSAEGLYWSARKAGRRHRVVALVTEVGGPLGELAASADAHNPPSGTGLPPIVADPPPRRVRSAVASRSPKQDTRGDRIAAAWKAFNAGRYADAQAQFAALYAERPEKGAAEGLFLSAEKVGALDSLQRNVPDRASPLRKRINAHRAQRFLDRGLFLAAHAENAELLPALRGLDAPDVSLGAGFRDKSGAKGTSKLQVETLPSAEATMLLDPRTELRLEIQCKSLDEGDPGSDSTVGRVPLPPTGEVFQPAQPPRFSYTTQEQDLFVPAVSFRREGEQTIFATLGTTPIGAAINPLPVGRFGLIQQTSRGYLQVELFADSVTESVLSTVGIRDPYTGERFGRVLEAGAAVETIQTIHGAWSLNGRAAASLLHGKGVASNHHLVARLGLGYNLPLRGFRYFSVGPTVSVDHFGENLSHFTTGHGGYFSPRYLVQGVIGLAFQTEESRSFVVRGYVAGGVQANEQAAAPYFPRDDDGRRFPGTRTSSAVFSANLASVYRLTDSWQVGVASEYRKSAAYDDYGAQIFLRHIFGQRPAVLSRDVRAVEF